MGWHSIQIVGAFACHFAPENPGDGEQRYDIWVLPRVRPHMPTQTGAGKPRRNAAQPCATAQCCVNDDLRTDGLRKG